MATAKMFNKKFRQQNSVKKIQKSTKQNYFSNSILLYSTF